jgi:hypothetical protein
MEASAGGITPVLARSQDHKPRHFLVMVEGRGSWFGLRSGFVGYVLPISRTTYHTSSHDHKPQPVSGGVTMECRKIKRHSNADQPNESRQPATLREAWNRRFGTTCSKHFGIRTSGFILSHTFRRFHVTHFTSILA